MKKIIPYFILNSLFKGGLLFILILARSFAEFIPISITFLLFFTSIIFFDYQIFKQIKDKIISYQFFKTLIFSFFSFISTLWITGTIFQLYNYYTGKVIEGEPQMPTSALVIFILLGLISSMISSSAWTKMSNKATSNNSIKTKFEVNQDTEINEQSFKFYSYNMLVFSLTLMLTFTTFISLFGSYSHNNPSAINETLEKIIVIFLISVGILLSYSLSRHEVKIFIYSDKKLRIKQGKLMHLFHNDDIIFNLNDIKKTSYISPGLSIFKRLKIRLSNNKQFTFNSEYFFGSKGLDGFVEYLENPQKERKSGEIRIDKKPAIYSKLWYQIVIVIVTLLSLYYLMSISLDDNYKFSIKTIIFIGYFFGVLHQLFEIIEVRKK